MTQLYIDSARSTEWEQALSCGLTSRATCNPLLLREAGLAVTLASLTALHAQAVALGLEELHLQAWPDERGDWLPVARQLSDLSDRVVVKLPAVQAAMDCAVRLRHERRRVLITAVSNPVHGLWAANVGADFVAPYVGRLGEAGRDVEALVDELVALQRGGGPRVLAASVRDLMTLGRLLRQGVAAVTLRWSVLQQAMVDQATLDAVRQFESARLGF